MSYNRNHRKRGTHYVTELHSRIKKRLSTSMREEGRTYKSITEEYGVSKASISKWCREFGKECQTDLQAQEDRDSMKENLQLKREIEELRKEITFLKKRRHSLQRKSIKAYRFIDSH